MEAEVRKFWDVVTGNQLPQINYASVVCHTNDDYDIIGLYWEEESAEAAGGGAVYQPNHDGTVRGR